MKPEAWKHEFIRANGIRFHYVTAGTGPLVLLLHGFPQFWYAWRRQIPDLARRFRVVAPDLRGYGDSDKPSRVSDYRAEVLAADVAGLIGALGEKKAAVVGHDWGGGAAWAAAVHRPEVVDRLVVLNCPHPLMMARAFRSDWRQLLRSWYMFFFQLPVLPERMLLRGGAAFLDGAFSGSAINKAAFTAADILEYKKALLKPGAASGALGYYRAAFRNPLALRGLRNITAPTLLIWGEEDAALGKELTLGMEPFFESSFEIRYVPGCGHWVGEEQPELVNRLLLDFLARPI